MTTSHRPTWKAAVGGEEQGGMRHYAPSKMQSVKDIAGFTKMKYRKEGQNNLEELKAKDLKSVLEEKERKHFLKASKEEFLAEKEEDLKLLEAGIEAGLNGPGGSLFVPKPIDLDDEDEDASDSDTDDEDDDEAELLAELARIKKEREEDAARKAAEEEAIAEKEERQEMMRGNPLLQDKLAGDANGGAGGSSISASFALKRRWDDDVVFKNQARNEPKQQRRFVNDTLRSDFHKRFLERYIK